MSLARALAAALALCAGEAAAHASLAESRPADGARLERAPASIDLRFDEDVRPLSLALLDGAGAAVELGAPRSEGGVVRVVPPPLKDGRYVFTYRVVSADSHPVGGAIVFAIGASAPEPAAAAPPEDPLAPWRVAARAVRLLALLVAAGAALFVVAVGRFPRQVAVLRIAAALGMAAVLAGVRLQDLGWDSTYGASAASALGGLAVIFLATLAGRPPRVALVVGALAALASFMLTGHSLTARPAGVAPAAVALHGLAAAFWAGSLVALLLLLRARSPAENVRALRRFSRIALVAVAVLAGAGALLACLQLDAPEALVDSAYGRTVLGKAGLLAALLALAALNRWRWLPAFERGADPRALRRSIAAEIALLGGVGALTAALAQTPPHERDPAVAEMQGRGYALRLEVAPGRAGVNTLELRLSGPREPAEVAVELTQPQAGVGPIARRLERVGTGRYRLRGGELALPGEWQVEVRLLPDDFESIALTGRIRIR